MARALVVHESVPGDTERIALAVAEGLATRLPVDGVRAPDAPPQVRADVRMLVVGGPTHAPGLHAWLGTVRLPPRTNAAAFDLRTDDPRQTTDLGATLVRGLGATLAAPTEYFVVDGDGLLADGEEDRARRWGRALGELVAARVTNGSG